MARARSWCMVSLMAFAFAAQAEDESEEDEVEEVPEPQPTIHYKQRVEIDFSAVPVTGSSFLPGGALPLESLGATPGGAQDISAFRALVGAGVVPSADAMTPEGLFSEHDLPLGSPPCGRLLCIDAAAVRARLVAQPEVDHLVQIGFGSGLDAATWTRPPLNLVLVVDESGSMQGRPIEAVRGAVRAVAARLGDGDRLTVIGFDDVVHVRLPTVSGGEVQAIEAAAVALRARGSTNLIGGLEAGFGWARAGHTTFDGVTRVVVMTDEQPNVGATDDASFMSLARAASAEGIGLTTFGIGMDLGAERMAAVSSVRGGNAVSFPVAQDVAPRIAEDLDVLFVELAYDLDIVFVPGPGVRVAGVYGVPGEGVAWTERGGIRMSVETLFASHERGGLFVGLQATERAGQGPLGRLSTSYTPRDGSPVDASIDVGVSLGPLPVGLTRGPALVDVATGVRSAIAAFEEGDAVRARNVLEQVAVGLASRPDPDLDAERALVRGLMDVMGTPTGRDRITGLPR